MTGKQYRILNLHAENIKKIKVVDITTDPKSNTVIISGANGNGKSSVLDCIEMACRGGDTLPGMPIRRGEEKGLIEINLGDLKIKRTFTEKGSYLFVESADGARYPQPQAMLDKMLGLIAFDPLEFTRLKPKQQYETIKGLVKLEGLEVLETHIKEREEERTSMGRQVKDLTAQVAGMVIPEGTPEEPVDVTVKSQAIINAKEDISEHANLKILYQGICIEIKKTEETITTLQTYLKDLQAREAKGKKVIEDHAKILLTEGDMEILRQTIETATKVNAAVAIRETKKAAEVKLKGLTDVFGALEKAITDGRQKKADMIADAKMPVKGLSLEDGVVLFKDIPLDQVNTAEQIRISTAIAMASNPALRVIRIKDASLLDDASMEIIRVMAEKHDFQVWLEVLSSSDPMAVVIEDGEVAEPVKKKAKKA